MSNLFTQAQLMQYAEYEYVRASADFNMFDPRAMRATGLNREDYLFVMKNYSELKKQFDESEDLQIMKLAELHTGAD